MSGEFSMMRKLPEEDSDSNNEQVCQVPDGSIKYLPKDSYPNGVDGLPLAAPH